MLIPVVLAGGSGTRLWPLSRASLPKPFVPLPARTRTLFQETLLRLGGRGGAPMVVCNERHRFLVAEQLRQTEIEDARILLEPAQRNTAPAAALAALTAADSNPDAVLLILPSDHLIREPEKLLAALDAAEQPAREGYLVTFGVTPTAPSTGYGYIAAAGSPPGTAVRKLERFVEKPDSATAESLLAAGNHFWNSGMFAFRAEAYLAELERHAPDILAACRETFAAAAPGADFLRFSGAAFAACRSLSIDHAVMEHTDRGAVIPLNAGWSDLGAWDAVWSNARRDERGNAISGDVIDRGLRGSLVHAGSSRLVAAIGLRDLILIDTADALLVAERGRAQEVGQLAAELQREARVETEHHRVVKRPWGSYQSLAVGPGFQVKHIVVDPGAALSLQEHGKRDEHWTVVGGRAVVVRDGEEFELGPGGSTCIPIGCRHRLRNDGGEPAEIIEVQIGEYLGEDDIVRYDDIYGRVED